MNPEEPMTTTDHDSDLALSATDRVALGAFRSYHPAASGIHKVNIGIASIFTLLLMGAAIAFLIAGLNQPGKGLEIGAAVFGALGLAPAIGMAFLIRKLFYRLYLFDNGFVFARGANRIVLWNEIQSFYEQQDVVAGIKADKWLRFLLEDGRRFTIDSSFKDFRTFAEAVRHAVTKVILMRAADVLPRGQAIAFGKLRFSQAGLEKEGEALSWKDVHSIRLEPRVDGQVHAYGVVIFKRATRSKTEKVEWYVKLIPRFGNVDAFLQLASQFTTVGDPNTRR
jgi:hypothetical protein